MLTVPVLLKKKECHNLWSAPGLYPENYHYHVDGVGESVEGQADRYGMLGSGRAAILNGAFVKGIGPTTLVNNDRPYYSTGGLTITDAVIEAIYLEAISRLFPDAIRPLSISFTNKMERLNLESAIDNGYNVNDVPLDRRIDHGALLVRDIPLRISHLYPMKLSRSEIMDHFVSYNPEIKNDKHCFIIKNYIIKVSNYLAVLFINRFSVGTTAISNISIQGVPFDTASSSFLRDFRNCWISSGKIPVWEENKVILNDLVSYIVDFMQVINIDDINDAVEMIDETYESVDEIWESSLKRASLLMLGFTLDEIDKLNPEDVSELQNCIISYIQKDTIDYDLYDGDIADWRAPKWVGLPFDKEFPSLVEHGQLTSFEPLNDAFKKFKFRFTEEHVIRCKKVCADRLPLTNVPTLELKLRNLRNVNGEINITGYRNVIDESMSYIDKIL